MGAARIALVGCGKSKLDRAAPARELYTGPLFRSALSYALEPDRFDSVYILSAKYGLLYLDEKIEPYDLALAQRDRAARVKWGRLVAASLDALHYRCPLDITCLAGRPYVDALLWMGEGYFFEHRWSLSAPLSGLGRGQRLAWFKQRRAA